MAKNSHKRTPAFSFIQRNKGTKLSILRNFSDGVFFQIVTNIQSMIGIILEMNISDICAGNILIQKAYSLILWDFSFLIDCYLDAIVNLLERYFELSRVNLCWTAINIYRNYVAQMKSVAELRMAMLDCKFRTEYVPDLSRAKLDFESVMEKHLMAVRSRYSHGESTSPGNTSVGNEMHASKNVERVVPSHSIKPVPQPEVQYVRIQPPQHRVKQQPMLIDFEGTDVIQPQKDPYPKGKNPFLSSSPTDLWVDMSFAPVEQRRQQQYVAGTDWFGNNSFQI